MQLNQTCSIDQAEQQLEEKLAGKTLIGELDLSREDVLHLGALLADSYAKFVNDPVCQIWKHFPCSAACFSVGVFSHFYEQNYWPHFRENLCELTPVEENEWRLSFESFLFLRGLPHYDTLHGQRMLKRVRIHALLTFDAAQRVFKNVVQPAYRAGLDEFGLTAAEILDETGARWPELRKPEEAFLRYGGYVADDILQDCIELYRAHLEGEAAAAFGLPLRILQAFEKWFDVQKDQARRQSSHTREARPYLHLSLSHQAVILVFPARRIGKDAADNAEIILRIGTDDNYSDLMIPVDPFTCSTPTRTEHVVEWPDTTYHVGEVDASSEGVEQIHERPVRGLWADPVKWAAFPSDNTNEFRISSRRVLPRGEVWLLCPKWAKLTAKRMGQENHSEESVSVIESFTLAPDGWDEYVVKLLDTKCLIELQLASPNAKHCRSIIPVDIAPAMELLGHLPGVAVGGRPVVSEGVCVVSGGSLDDLTVDIQGLAPSRRYQDTVSASCLEDFMSSAPGVYRLTVRGRLGQKSSSVEVAVLPGLSVRFTPKWYLPGGGEKVTLRLKAPWTTEAPRLMGKGQVCEDADEWVISTDGQPNEISVDLPLDTVGQNRATLTLIVPRLQVAFGTQPQPVGFSHHPVQIPGETLNDSLYAHMWLRLQPVESEWHAKLSAEPLGIELDGGQVSRRSEREFNLTQLRDALKENCQNCSLKGSVRLPGESCDKSLHLGTIIARPRLLHVEANLSKGKQLLRYRFDPTCSVSSNLRLVPAAFPWEQPREVGPIQEAEGVIEVAPPLTGTFIVEPGWDRNTGGDILTSTSSHFLTLLGPVNKPAALDPIAAPIQEFALAWINAYKRDDSGKWQLDEDEADNADFKMGQKKKYLKKTLIKFRMRPYHFRMALLLMLHWGQKVVADGSFLAAQYWQQAVWQLWDVLPRESNDMWVKKLRDVACEAAQPTRDLAARLERQLQWCGERRARMDRR